MVACFFNKPRILTTLIRAGADLTVRNNEGNLFKLSFFCHTPTMLVKQLLKKNSMNVKNLLVKHQKNEVLNLVSNQIQQQINQLKMSINSNSNVKNTIKYVHTKFKQKHFYLIRIQEKKKEQLSAHQSNFAFVSFIPLLVLFLILLFNCIKCISFVSLFDLNIRMCFTFF